MASLFQGICRHKQVRSSQDVSLAQGSSQEERQRKSLIGGFMYTFSQSLCGASLPKQNTTASPRTLASFITLAHSALTIVLRPFSLATSLGANAAKISSCTHGLLLSKRSRSLVSALRLAAAALYLRSFSSTPKFASCKANSVPGHLHQSSDFASPRRGKSPSRLSRASHSDIR